MLKDIHIASKPRLVRGNMLLVVASYIFALQFVSFDAKVFLSLIIGSYLIMSSACIVNNMIDRNYDKFMKRTKNRPTVRNNKNLNKYVTASTLMVLSGILILIQINNLTALLGVAGFILYSFVYTLSKRYTVYNTYIGGVPGALPSLSGYTAATGNIDLSGFMLFTTLFCWQIPHFYALAINQLKGYKASGFKMMPIYKGIYRARIEMIIFSVLYTVLVAYIGLSSGVTFLIPVLVLGANIFWLKDIILYNNSNVNNWSITIFKRSIYALTIYAGCLVFIGLTA